MRTTLVLVALTVTLATAVLLGPATAGAQQAVPKEIKNETEEERSARMKWWREARFGMFVHWGLYAVPAGTWNGKKVASAGEWIQNGANIPVEEYEKMAPRFNPVRFDPAEWVRIAKEAGMKYIVITSKHHDGFCLYETEATKYNVVDATPYGKDLLKPLADECRRQGLRFCTYYSIMDWHHPAQMRGSEKQYNPTKIKPGRKADYMAFVKQQLRELLESCDPDVLWFDGEWPDWFTPKDGWDLYHFLRSLKPELIINNRVGTGRKGTEGLDRGDRNYAGDFGTPEQQIPATGLPGVDWESCMTMNDTWGYKTYDDNWKSSQTLIHNVIDTASKGGNYLLNVGPTAEGRFPDPSVERLREIGRWMKINGESIYATQASPFEKTPWGRCTRKTLDGERTRLYLHVFKWPADRRLAVPASSGKPVRAFLLDGGRQLSFTAQDGQVVLSLPAAAPDAAASVIVLDIKSP